MNPSCALHSAMSEPAAIIPPAAPSQSPAELVIPARPHMEGEGIARLETLMRSARRYLEYGSGGSTMLAGRLGIPLIISVESDPLWSRKVREQFCPRYLRSLLVSLHANIGPTKSWGHPVDSSQARVWPRYATAAWRFIERTGRRPELILIDGRFRSACLLVSLSCGEPGSTILLDDYVGRNYKDVVERFIQPVAFHGRMAEFVVPQTLALPPAAFALSLAQCLVEPA